jgi:hypothetical protein
MPARRANATPIPRRKHKGKNVTYAINYGLKRPGQNHAGLHAAIKDLGASRHYLGSTFLVETSLNANQIWEHLSPHVDKTDLVLMVCVMNDTQGWLPEEAWDWINQRAPSFV